MGGVEPIYTWYYEKCKLNRCATQTGRQHGNFQTWIGVLCRSDGLYLLKRISVSLVWIHTGHVMCVWTHLDPFFIR